MYDWSRLSPRLPARMRALMDALYARARSASAARPPTASRIT